jgi:uncharacterized iron-regulated membrane protein
MRKIAVWVHRYLGLALGLLLLVSGLTGSIIVFNKPIDAALNPSLLRVEPQASAASLDVVLRQAREAVPGSTSALIFFPAANDLAMEVWFDNGAIRAYADPYTGEILGVRNATDSLMGFLVDLHIHLLSGEIGETIMGWSGLGAILLTILGVVLWWPKKNRWKQALSVKWQAAPNRVWLDIHKVAGAMAGVLILITAATGSSLALYNIITEPIFTALTGEGAKTSVPQSSIVATGASAPLLPMVAQARALFPNGVVTRVTPASDPKAAVMVRMRQQEEVHQFGRTFVWFDQYDGSLLRVDDVLEANLATRIQVWLYPLHTGFYGGLLTRWLQVLAGLSLCLLTLSGAYVWYKGYRARSMARARQRLMPRKSSEEVVG